MALGRISIKAGTIGKAEPHANYIMREGEYKRKKDLEPMEGKGHGNLPAWALDKPQEFWAMADQYERKNGSTYREHELSLPRELTPQQRLNLVKEWIAQEIGDKYAYSWAIHNPLATDGDEQPHCHLMFSERILDGIDRDPDQFFKRYNAKNPEKGGCKKDNTGLDHKTRKQMIKDQRLRWQDLVNKHLEKAPELQYADDPPPQVDLRNWRERGLDQAPINLTRAEFETPEIKQIYTQQLLARKAYQQANQELYNAKLDYMLSQPQPSAVSPTLAEPVSPFEPIQPTAESPATEQALEPIEPVLTVEDVRENMNYLSSVIAHYNKYITPSRENRFKYFDFIQFNQIKKFSDGLRHEMRHINDIKNNYTFEYQLKLKIDKDSDFVAKNIDIFKLISFSEYEREQRHKGLRTQNEQYNALIDSVSPEKIDFYNHVLANPENFKESLYHWNKKLYPHTNKEGYSLSQDQIKLVENYCKTLLPHDYEQVVQQGKGFDVLKNNEDCKKILALVIDPNNFVDDTPTETKEILDKLPKPSYTPRPTPSNTRRYKI